MNVSLPLFPSFIYYLKINVLWFARFSCTHSVHMFIYCHPDHGHPHFLSQTLCLKASCLAAALTQCCSVNSYKAVAVSKSFFFLKKRKTFYIEVYSINNVVIVPGTQQSNSTIYYTCIHSPPKSPPIQAAM